MIENFNMLADPSYTRFIHDAVRGATIYSLQDNENFFAECPSEEYDNEWGEPIAVHCFWTNRADAVACQQEEWADYTLVAMSLDDFMQEVLLDLDDMAKLVGVAFDAQLFGTEIEPIDLLKDLLDEIERQNLCHQFVAFDDLRRYCQEWQMAMQEPRVIH